MSVLLSSTHKGNTYEILGDFLLTLLGTATPQRRQFDHGYDFYCNLSHEVNGFLSFDSPFTIQIKSGNISKVQYGKPYKKWKQIDVNWLYAHQIPFFLGFIDIDKKSLSIYDTSGIWFLFGLEYFNCSQIVFKPNKTKPGIRRALPVKTKIKNWGTNCGDGFRQELDLGNPIITISVNDIDDAKTLNSKKDILRQFINIERENISNRNNGVYCFKEIKQNTTNCIENIEWGLQILGNYNEDYISKIYDSINFALLSLNSNLKFHEREKEFQAISELLSIMPQKDFYKNLYLQNRELFNWVKDKGE